MTYEKIKFLNGQILKADHLNHMEDGIETLSNAFNSDTTKLNDSYIPDVVLTNDDKLELANYVKSTMNTTELTFTLEDGSVVTKVVYVQ